jgi:oligopeptide transport system substrate-binding protein
LRATAGWLTTTMPLAFLALVKCDDDQNAQKNCNREAEKLIDEGNQSLDPAKRKLADPSRQNDHGRLPHALPLLQYTQPRLVKSYVGGYTKPTAWTATAPKSSTSSSIEPLSQAHRRPVTRVGGLFLQA